MNCYLQVGRLACPLQSPPPPWGREVVHRVTGLTPIRQHHSSKGNEVLLPHPSAASQAATTGAWERVCTHGCLVHPLGRVHTTWHRPHTFPAGHWRKLHLQFATMPTHGYSVGHSRYPSIPMVYNIHAWFPRWLDWGG
jgi:hypothetical protein